MGTWIELRCEATTKPEAEGPKNDAGAQCFSRTNAGPMMMANDTMKDIQDTVRFLANEALDSGWIKDAGGWYCPFCVQSRKEQQ